MAHKATANVAGTTAVSRGQDPLQAQYTWSAHKIIGSGTFGKVVAGARLVDGRNYALKHVDTTCAEWQLECQLLSGMGHPNVVRAVDMFEPRPTTGVAEGERTCELVPAHTSSQGHGAQAR